MEESVKYFRFVDGKKQFIYEYVKGFGEMAIYSRGKVRGKKSQFDKENISTHFPKNALKYMVHRGIKCEEYEDLDALEQQIFIEDFLEAD